MAGELVIPYNETGVTLYAHLVNATGAIYRQGATNAFETYATANIAEYAITLTEKGTASRIYGGTMPTTNVPAGWYKLHARKRSGGSPAETDALVYEDTGHWSGTAWTFVGGAVASVTGAVGSVTGNVGGNVVGSVASVTGSVGSVASGGITAASIATGAIDADAIATDAVTEIQAGLSTLDAAGVRTAVGLASANLDTQLTAIDDYLDTEVAAIKAKTDLIPASPAAVGSEMALADGAITAAKVATDAAQEIADTILTRQITESYNADGAAPTLAQALCVIMQALTEHAISGTTWTIKKLDGSTTALTLTLNDATDPTSVTRSG